MRLWSDRGRAQNDNMKTTGSDESIGVDALIVDLLDWIGPQPRPYAEVIDAWKTSCPRLPVWEEANARGFIGRQHENGGAAMVSVTASGNAFLGEHQRHR